MTKKAVEIISFIVAILGASFGVKSLLSLDIAGILIGVVIFLVCIVIFGFATAMSQTSATNEATNQNDNNLIVDTPSEKYSSTKNLPLEKSETGLTNARTFKLAGVTFEDRPHNLQVIKQCQNRGEQIKIALNKYIYNGKYAIAVTANSLELGNIKSENLDFVLDNLYRICGYEKLYINNFTNENGNTVWYAEIKLVLVNKKEAKEYEM
jgi:hypothetical protein